MLVWAVWCYPDTCLELLKVIWSWAVFPDVGAWRDAARASLREWQHMEACTTFGASPIGPRGILPDKHVEALTFKHDVSSVDDIERKLRDPPWVLVRKYGADVLRILQKIDEEELHRRQSTGAQVENVDHDDVTCGAHLSENSPVIAPRPRVRHTADVMVCSLHLVSAFFRAASSWFDLCRISMTTYFSNAHSLSQCSGEGQIYSQVWTSTTKAAQ